MKQIESGQKQGLVCADTLTTIHYVARKQLGTKASLAKVRELLKIFGVAPVTGTVISSALDLEFGDFEDAVLHESARLSGANCIVTRNVQDFRKALIPIYTPVQFLAAT